MSENVERYIKSEAITLDSLAPSICFFFFFFVFHVSDFTYE